MLYCIFFFFNDTATTEIYTLSLHDALPISPSTSPGRPACGPASTSTKDSSSCWFETAACTRSSTRSEEHTSELQSHLNLVCRLLLEKKKNTHRNSNANKREIRSKLKNQ